MSPSASAAFSRRSARRLPRPPAAPVAPCLALALLLIAGAARATEVEVGPVLGAHFFSDDNQLGRYLNGPPNLAPQHMGLVGVRLSVSPWAHLSLEAVVAFIPSFVRADPQPFAPILTYRGDLRIDLLTGRIRPFVLAGGGAHMLFATSGLVRSSTQEFLDVGAGCLFDLGRNVGLRVDLRLLFVPSVERLAMTGDGTRHDLVTQDFEALLALYWRFGSNAAPAIGAARPPAAGGATAVAGGEREGEAPPPASDQDGDGVSDASDRCPAQAGAPENRGCPDEDGDGDGLVDRLDRCPASPGPTAGQGCPDTDRDLDETVDREDRCPDRPGPRDNHGCPDVDQDGDGIVDRLDRCPDRPETKNRWQDDDGCPDELPADLKRIVGVVAGLEWKGPTSVEPKKDSLAVLDEAARVLAERPELRIEIGAHTDNSGNIVKNTHLSQRRADAIREYLVKKGIARARLRSVGYGPTRPLGDNAAPDGRAENRRVEIQLVP